MIAAEQTKFVTKVLWVLATGDSSHLDLDRLPAASDWALIGLVGGPGSKLNLGVTLFMNSCSWAALAFERLGRGGLALEWSAQALEDDPLLAGNENFLTRTLALGCRGRVLAATPGREAEAAAAFEDATAAAQHRGYNLLEAATLTDRQERLPSDVGGSADQPTPAVAVAKLASAPDVVERFLGNRFEGWAAITGADTAGAGASEAAERARVEKLRRAELLALRVSELKQWALGVGIAQSEIDEADDSEGGPKAALVDLIMSSSNWQRGGGGDSSRSQQPEAKHAGAIAGPKRQSRPHFGAPAAAAKTAVTEPLSAGKVKVAAQHAMLSYSWNSQSKVVAARKQLGEHGIRCWMDIDGNTLSRVVTHSFHSIATC